MARGLRPNSSTCQENSVMPVDESFKMTNKQTQALRTDLNPCTLVIFVNLMEMQIIRDNAGLC